MNANDLEQLIGAFVAETQEFLQVLETNLLLLERSDRLDQRVQAVKDLFRAAHSIKGSALMLGFESLSKAAHSLEDCFAILRDRANLLQLSPKTTTALLQGVDCLKILVDRSMTSEEVAAEVQALAEVKLQLEAEYGTEPSPPIALQITANDEVIKAIFEHELPTVLNQLEAELSQARPEQLSQTIATLSKIYYQLSGLAGMLQLPAFAQIADPLDALIRTPGLTFAQLQSQGWAIAHNLQTARQRVLAGQPIRDDLVSVAAPSAQALSEALEPMALEVQEAIAESPTVLFVDPVELTASELASSTVKAWQRPTIRIEVDRLTELVNLVGELVINRTNLELQEAQLRSEIKRIHRSVAELTQAGGHLREEYDRMSVPDLRLDKTGINHQSAQLQNVEFDVLELDQYTEFHSTAQSLIDSTYTVSQCADRIDSLAVKVEQSTDQLRRITDQLRSRVMQLRVVSFSRVVDHLPRALRELCRTYNKDVNLLLLGRETKIDESLLDALRDPLVHLVRNAFDHGIESPEERIAAGKLPTGQIEIEAFHQGGQTVVTVTDDGRGIDVEAIRRRIVNKGLVEASQAQELTTADLYEFLFWPGFSTAPDVTHLSGRGVGLDVVRSNLRQVRGAVKIDSRLGKGTSFILKLPLMLSITDALLVKIHDHTVAVPLDAIEEILHIQPHQIQRAGKQPLLHWRNEFIRLAWLKDLLHYSHTVPSEPAELPEATEATLPVLVLTAGEQMIAIAVEKLVGQQEIVVKPIPVPLPKPSGIVGSTVLGNGEVVLILDVDDLVDPLEPQHQAIAIRGKQPPTLAAIPASQPQILVVDDSYTIRQLLTLTLTRARYRVIQAKDGQDAWEQLQQGLQCDCVIADIEMPRMDGFELLRSLKAEAKLASIPVMMLTSRSGAKHRQTALTLGASYYFTKPYHEAQLLETLANLLAAQPTPRANLT